MNTRRLWTLLLAAALLGPLTFASAAAGKGGDRKPQAKGKHDKHPGSKGKHDKRSAPKVKRDKRPQAEADRPAPDAAGDKGLHRKKPFIVYDHIHNRGRPDDLTPYGLVPIELCYNTKTKEGVLSSVKSKYDKTGGPVVFDIEKTNRADHNVSTQHLKNVAKWAREAAPKCKIGFYAVGPSNLTPLKRPIEKVVDAFFPSMYVHNVNRRMWGRTARKLVQQGHRHHKPVYLFLMPKFHGRKGKDIPQAFWSFQLRSAYRSGADGVVIWSSKKHKWSEKTGWWQATKRFMKDLKAGGQAES